jgi:hypothetical protein
MMAARVAQVFDGLEERDGLEAGVGVGGVAAAAFDADAAEAREPDDVEARLRRRWRR